MPHALPRALALLLLETLLVFCLVAVAARMHLSGDDWRLSLAQHGVLKVLLIVFVTQVCLYFANLYGSQQVINRRDLIVRIMQAVGAASFILAGIYLWRPDMTVGRGVFLYAAVLVIIGVAGWRMLIDLTTRAIGRRQLDHKG
jgi:FlaA1/EpsC-like NDP-sugar epimerase